MGYMEIISYAQKKGVCFSGSPYACYFNSDLEKLDVEIGFPIARCINGNDKIIGRVIPSEKVVSGLFLGAYESSDELMNKIFEWAKDNGYKTKSIVYNYYLNDENRPKDQLLTRIALPID